MTDQGPQFDADHDALTRRFGEYDRALDSHWGDWMEDARTAYDFVASRQWSSEDQEAFREDNRIMATINRVETTIDAVVGAEIMGRQEVTYLPRTVDDTGVTDVLSQGAQYVRQNCDAEDEETDAFRDMTICGIGWTESKPDYSEELDGQIVINRIDPLEMAADPSSRKGNFADARYIRRRIRMTREEADETFGLDAYDPVQGDQREPVIVDPQMRYKNGQVDDDADEVEVSEYQWFEERHVLRASIDGMAQEIPEDQYEAAVTAGLNVIRQKRRVYMRAFHAAGRVFDAEELEVGEFTYKAMTGKRDRNKGTYYGLVKPMIDPQRFANTAISAAINHYRETAKGGVMIEAGAVEDQRDFEDSWTDARKITWVKDGAVTAARFAPKPTSQLPSQLPAILQMSIEGIRDTTGVNLELLGMADRQQPGVLEHQRKQAAYGILSSFFNAIRRYRKEQGRLLLKLMRLYLPEGELVRIVGDDGQARFVPMAYGPEAMKYDVIVDEAPTSPNQKERVFAILSQFQGLLGEASPQILAEFIRYSPLPANVAEKIAGILASPPDPAQQQAQAQQQALMAADAEQKIRKTASEAAKNEAQVRESDAEAAKNLTESMLNETATQALINTGAV
jgi:hypothetical protein